MIWRGTCGSGLRTATIPTMVVPRWMGVPGREETVATASCAGARGTTMRGTFAPPAVGWTSPPAAALASGSVWLECFDRLNGFDRLRGFGRRRILTEASYRPRSSALAGHARADLRLSSP